MSKAPNSIAKNTLFLYLRMLITLCVTIYTSRVVIEALGVTDYGIYNLVAGVSTSFVFFSSALSTSTQRFLTFEIGRGDRLRLGHIFSLSLEIYGAIAILVLIAGLCIGDWLVTEKLVIPAESRSSALIALYAMMLQLALMLPASVYESALIAHENMKLYAWLGITDACAKLAIAYAVIYMPHKLATYASLMVVAQLIPYIIMVTYCLRRYPETHPKWYWSKSAFKEMFGFTGWNMYGSVIWMVNEQGITVLLNLFFGPVVNAARGVATSVNNAVNNFSTQFFTAVRPQIIKRYASELHESLLGLIFSSSKFTLYLLWLLCLPIMLRADYILHLWLKQVPEYSTQFVIWTLAYTMVNSLNNPSYTALSATGHLRRGVLIGSNLFLLAFPISYIALKCGLAPVSVYPALMAGRLAFFVVTVHELRRYIPVTYGAYACKVGWPLAKVICLSLIILLPLNALCPSTFMGLMLFTAICIVISLCIIYSTGLVRSERMLVIDKIKHLLHKIS